MKLKLWIWPALCALTLAPAARASAILPGVSADVNLLGQPGVDRIVLKEIELNFSTGNPNAVVAKSLPLLATVAGQGTNACTGSSISGAASVANVTAPAVLVSGAAAGTVCENGQSVGSILYVSAYLKYAFEVVGPATSTIPVLFQGSNSMAQSITTSSSTVKVIAAATIVDSAGNTVTNEGGGNYDVALSIDPNALYYVELSAGYQVNTRSTVLVSAYADPTLTIDPSFSNAADYSIAYSPDLTQSAVPEPGSLSLLGSGFALLVLRRARKPRR
jgi:hypothetical protein